MSSGPPGCTRCHKALASGIWRLTYPNGKEEIRLLCASCGLSDIPQTNTIIRLVAPLIYDPEPTHCTSGLELTGSAVKTETSVFFEMLCPKCGFCTDVPHNKVKNAIRAHSHKITSKTQQVDEALSAEGEEDYLQPEPIRPESVRIAE